MKTRHRRRKADCATRGVMLLAAGLLLLVADYAVAERIDMERVGHTKAEACEGVRKDAHVMMGGPRQGGRLPSYCGDCVREVVMEHGKPVERWVCRVTVEIFN